MWIRQIDKMYLWKGWPIIKWPFGALLCGFILWIIWSKECNDHFDQKIITAINNMIIVAKTTKLSIPIKFSPAIKNY